MNKHTLAALIVLNVVLFFALLVTAPTSTHAQGFGGNQGAFVMIAGDLKGRNQQDAIYIIERNTGNMIAMTYEPSQQRVRPLGRTNLANDIRAAQGGGR